MSKKVLIGYVGVDSGQIVITDPCYIDSYWEKDKDMEDWRIYKNKKSGKLYQYKSNTPQYFEGKKLAVMFNNYDEKIENGKSMNELLESNKVVAVPKPTNYRGEFSYRSCCEKTLAKTADKDGQLENMVGANIGVVSSSGYGDGHYPVYAEFIDEGMGKRVSKLTIEFMGTPTQEFARKALKGGKK